MSDKKEGISVEEEKHLARANLWAIFIGGPIGLIIVGFLNSLTEFGIGGIPTALIMLACFYIVKKNIKGNKNVNQKVVEPEITSIADDEKVTAVEEKQTSLDEVKKPDKSARLVWTLIGIFLLFYVINSVVNSSSSEATDKAKAESFKDSFTYACEKTASEEYCSCLLNAVESNYTEKEMVEEAKRISETNTMSDKYKDLTASCLK